MSISYKTDCEGLGPQHLRGFFVGWPHPPSPEMHLAILRNSTHVVLAHDDETGQVVGFANAISDRVLAAYIPLLEVLPDYRNRGIGSELVRRLLRLLGDLYMIDLMCDSDLEPFYRRLGMTPGSGMRVRNFAAQAGRKAEHRREERNRP